MHACTIYIQLVYSTKSTSSASQLYTAIVFLAMQYKSYILLLMNVIAIYLINWNLDVTMNILVIGIAIIQQNFNEQTCQSNWLYTLMNFQQFINILPINCLLLKLHAQVKPFKRFIEVLLITMHSLSIHCNYILYDVAGKYQITLHHVRSQH